MVDLKTYSDHELKDLYNLMCLVRSEGARQVDKWGIQNRTAFEWMTYLTEEVGELAEAISEAEYRGGDRARVKKEAIQVATLALKIAEMMGG